MFSSPSRPDACKVPSTIAIVMDYLYDFQVKVLRGIHQGLDDVGLASLTFLGRDLHPADQTCLKANDLYGLIDPRHFQGIIFSAASLGNSTSEQALHEFTRRFSGLPAVTVSRPVGHLPAVLVDNASGMRELMLHLIRKLGYRKFVYVQGMKGNPEAELRERVVIETLAQHGLALKPEHILPGEFFGPRAAQEMGRLLQNDRDFEVVVCANDEMAFGVMRVLMEQGIPVPSEVAVVGFDDIEEAQLTSPALTTVRQPIAGTGEKAAQLLLQTIRGEELQGQVQLPAHLVVRKSCGTLPDWTFRSAEGSDLSHHQDLRDAFLQALQDPARSSRFLMVWRRTLARFQGQPETSRGLLASLDEEGRDQAEVSSSQRQELMFLAMNMLVESQQGTGSGHDLSLSRTNQMSSRLELALTSHRHLETLREDIPRYMAGRGIDRYAVVLFAQPASDLSPEASVFCASMHCAELDVLFPTVQLLPPSMQQELQTGHLLVVPLFLNDLHYGLLLFEKPAHDHFDVEHLRYTLSSALHHVHAAMIQQAYTENLEQQVRERTRELENEIAVRLRAEKALRIANQELQQSALTDALTGIFNRAAFDTHLQREWINHQIAHQTLSILLCDVDFFKQYNDLYGHLQGDECLKRIARTLDTSGRNHSDFAARYGGEEFVMVLSSTDETGAGIVADRLCAAIRNLEIPHQGSRVHPHVTVSIGLATVVPCSELNPDQVVEWADQALYRSKAQGRNRFTVYRPAPSSEQDAG